MPYYGRTVGRAKGVGKIVYWKQGGGPKKAGLGPQINVTTWHIPVIEQWLGAVHVESIRRPRDRVIELRTADVAPLHVR